MTSDTVSFQGLNNRSCRVSRSLADLSGQFFVACGRIPDQKHGIGLHTTGTETNALNRDQLSTDSWRRSALPWTYLHKMALLPRTVRAKAKVHGLQQAKIRSSRASFLPAASCLPWRVPLWPVFLQKRQKSSNNLIHAFLSLLSHPSGQILQFATFKEHTTAKNMPSENLSRSGSTQPAIKGSFTNLAMHGIRTALLLASGHHGLTVELCQQDPRGVSPSCDGGASFKDLLAVLVLAAF